MTIDNDKIRELLTELIDLDLVERNERLDEIKEESFDLYEELQSLLPFTDDDRDEIDKDPLIGELVGHFTIKQKIGSGGMGRVYLARQEKPDRDVAFKILRRGLLSRSASKRFEIECSLLGRLHHGGIAQIYEAGMYTIDGYRIPWIAMEYIDEATPLISFAQNKKLDTNEKLELFMSVCKAVAEAHRRGIIHRDLKPENILVDSQGTPKIIDFGVAKAIDPMGMSTALITQSKDLVGTMQYMSPEQAGGEDVGVTTDVYSLGVILYELLSGERPYDLQSTTITKAIETLKHYEPKPLRVIYKKLPRDIETIVEHSMAHEPLKRYRSVNELCDDIQNVLDGEPISKRKESTFARFLRRKRRTAAAIVIAMPILAIATTTSVYFALTAQHELKQKEQLVEFAKEALATRKEIIVTQPKYWKTHFELSMQRANKIGKSDLPLLIEMYDMISAVVDSEEAETSTRIKTAELIGLDTERGALLAIEHSSSKGGIDSGSEIEKIENLRKQFSNPSDKFIACAFLAQGKLEIRSEKKSVRDIGRKHIQEARKINREKLGYDFCIEFSAQKTVAWADIFREGTEDSIEHVFEIITPEFLEQTINTFGESHPNTLSTINFIGLAHEELGDFESAITVLRPAARVAAESYGVGHNLTWRYLNNLAMALVLKANCKHTSISDSIIIKQQAAALWYECIRQSIMHQDDGTVNWYGNTFRDMLPEMAPSKEELENWAVSIQYNGKTEYKDSPKFDFRSALVDTH